MRRQVITETKLGEPAVVLADRCIHYYYLQLILVVTFRRIKAIFFVNTAKIQHNTHLIHRYKIAASSVQDVAST